MTDKCEQRKATKLGLGVTHGPTPAGSGRRPRHVSVTAPVSDADAREAVATEPPPRSTSRPRKSRSPIRVDDVGVEAVALADKAARRSVPQLLKQRGQLRDAPLDHRDAFVLSLIDGTTDRCALADVSGLQRSVVDSILARLAELGIISLA